MVYHFCILETTSRLIPATALCVCSASISATALYYSCYSAAIFLLYLCIILCYSSIIFFATALHIFLLQLCKVYDTPVPTFILNDISLFSIFQKLLDSLMMGGVSTQNVGNASNLNTVKSIIFAIIIIMTVMQNTLHIGLPNL
jgi:hypothetical protein